ncbi:MAG: ABC transporter ATP-binding protein, partial [Candidatus Heimdallarchaeota archaeon]|nr:ABC transporter ATP-binding protein [Candidatus Heimdallarchaeota archaeon]
PEFTGRENVLMKGIRIGLSKYEMKERLPQIQDFADIGEFIDYPLKTYSSGMFVRLAFATAINIDPEILIVDEALAVGDAKFQHKCYQKFIEFQKNGKTIIFVTHDTGAIAKHCDNAILLESGAILQNGKPNDVANSYYELLFTGGVEKLGVVPDLIEEDYNGFNIVYYMKKYYAFAQTLGPVDLTQPGEQELKRYQASDQCFVGNSLNDVKYLVVQVSSQKNEVVRKPEQSPLEIFLKEIPKTDQCIYRKSYNNNEVRFGDKRAEIIDYLVVCENEHESEKIRSGSVVNIYLKVKFHKTVKSPAFGFSIKSVDGIIIYASNTRFSKIPVKSAEKSTVIIFKFSIKIDLHWGDIFITLGCGEKLDDEIGKPIEIREDLIHLVVLETKKFDGFVELDTSFQEILRNKW